MALRGVTFDQQLVYSRDDRALTYRTIGKDCIIWGMVATGSGTSINIGAGYAVIGGGVVYNDSSTSLDTSGITSGEGYVQVAIIIDTSIPSDPDNFTQGSYQLAFSATPSFPALPADEINAPTSGTRGFQVCIAQVNSSGIITSIIDNGVRITNINTIDGRSATNASNIATLTPLVTAATSNIATLQTTVGNSTSGLVQQANTATTQASQAYSQANNAVTQINAINSLLNNIVWRAGDSINITWWGAATTSNAAQDLYFTIPLTRPIYGVAEPTSVAFNTWAIRHETTTIVSNAAVPTGTTIVSSAVNQTGITLRVRTPSAISGMPNNSVVSLYIGGWTITL